MSFINFNRYNRSKLSEEQRVFLSRILPWAAVIQDYCLHKAIYRRIWSPAGIRASIIAADIIMRSEWGQHPVSQKRYQVRSANNLSLLESNELWEQDHHFVTYEEVKYRCYDDWAQYAQDASDFYVGSRNYDHALLMNDLEKQAQSFCRSLGRLAGYESELLLLITDLGLHDYDLKYA